MYCGGKELFLLATNWFDYHYLLNQTLSSFGGYLTLFNIQILIVFYYDQQLKIVTRVAQLLFEKEKNQKNRCGF